MIRINKKQVIITIIYFIFLSNNTLSNNLELKITGKSQIENTCYINFQLLNKTQKDIKNININFITTSFFLDKIGIGEIKTANINQSLPYTYTSSVKLKPASEKNNYVCKDITNIFILPPECKVLINKNHISCIKLLKFKNEKSIINVSFIESKLITNQDKDEEEYIQELGIKVTQINTFLAKKYHIKNYNKGLIVLSVNNNNIFREGDLLIEMEMLPLLSAKSIQEIIISNINNDDHSSLINFVRNGNEKWITIKLN